MAQSVDRTATRCVSEGSASERAVTASSGPSSSMTSVGCVEETTPAALKSWEPSPKRGTDLNSNSCCANSYSAMCCLLSVSTCNLLSLGGKKPHCL